MDGMIGAAEGLHSYNRRCLRRDHTTQALIDILVGKLSNTIKLFIDDSQVTTPNGVGGSHTAGHYFIDGDGGSGLIHAPYHGWTSSTGCGSC
ncbi:uncharacterized protein PgNI_09256 [Pyricularia grisea]|uniref:Uncharacterized protein n=1 Tax=Pyricularia grisea TaxID=148305 RepID=A0A6P8ARH7_PYRGI|nr:uncharacterized protein PgNI_09256 [Pyricularia grisea]TLD04734.1 hypothetical protein PgNI_09256 [Pyricularia grisea]